MKKSKFNYSNRTKILVVGMVMFVTLQVTSLFTDIIEENRIYQLGFSICILGWVISMNFDGKQKKIELVINRNKYYEYKNNHLAKCF